VQDALKQGLIPEADIDANLRGVFRVMIRLGMLEPAASDPYSRIGTGAQANGNVDDPWWWAKNKALARKVTDESIVLLKNEGGLLPLKTASLKSIAVIGPLADRVALDWYSGTPPFAVTPWPPRSWRARPMLPS
jgi:beta-glucosidase